MALENIGLGGVLKFDEKQAIRGMRSATRASDRFRGAFSKISGVARQVGQSMGQIASSMRGLGVAAIPATAALGFGVKQAANFEQQMSAVEAVSRATAEEMEQLTAKAKAMGATTVFSATQAAAGMESLARAGFSVDDQIAALGPTLSAAAADSIELAQAADIVSNTLKGLALPATDAARVADVLALASSKTNTNMVGLGEAMKFAAPQAKTLGVSLETTTAILGAVADAGLRGTIGGTSFTQALVKLTKPTSTGAALLEKFNIVMTKTATGGLDVVDVFKQINEGLKTEADVVARARMQTEIFGIRGQKAFAAAATAIDNVDKPLEGLVTDLLAAEGAAAKMAEIRLDNTLGAFTLLKSATEGFALETAGLFLGPMTDGVKGFTEHLSGVVLVLQELNSETGLTEETADNAGATMVQVAKGIKDGIDTVIDAWVELRTQITSFISKFTGEQSPDMIQKFAKMATMMFVIAAAVGPVLLALGGLAFFVSTVLVPVFGVIGSVIGALFSGPVLAGVAVLAAAFLLVRNEGESIGSTFTRVKDGIVSGFMFILNNAIMPLADGFMFIVGAVLPAFVGSVSESATSIWNDFRDVFGAVFQGLQALGPWFKVAFTLIGNIVGIAATGIGVVFAGVFSHIAGGIKVFRNVVISIIESIVNAVKGVAELLGLAAGTLGLDVSQKLLDFGRGQFRVEVGAERGLGATASSLAEKEALKQQGNIPPDMATVMAELAAQTAGDQPMFTPGDIDSISQAVGEAVAGNQPKEIKVEAKLCVDGKTVAKATAKHKQELNDRAGFKATPWQRRALAENGAAPVGGV